MNINSHYISPAECICQGVFDWVTWKDNSIKMILQVVCYRISHPVWIRSSITTLAEPPLVTKGLDSLDMINKEMGLMYEILLYANSKVRRIAQIPDGYDKGQIYAPPGGRFLHWAILGHWVFCRKRVGFPASARLFIFCIRQPHLSALYSSG